MSGGVDSSAAALILKQKKYNIMGLTMLISDEKTPATLAKNVCEQLDIPHFYVNIQNEFKKRVSTPFSQAYKQGITPNPCADCNEQIKFGQLWQLAENSWGNNFFIATGHYARIVKKENEIHLARAICEDKDQSYFLSGIKKDQLKRILFSLGEFKTKEATRELVRREGLFIADKPDSMDICFANEKNYRSLLSPAVSGKILDNNGNVLGVHKGIENFTLGQRKGLGISAPHPLYVIKIDNIKHSITVAERNFAFSRTVKANRLNILSGEYLSNKQRVLLGKTRYQADLKQCKITELENTNITVEFNEPIFAPTQGQRLVLYSDDGIVVAGGVIRAKE